MMHPFLLPGEWLATGRFVDPMGGETLAAGAIVVTATPEFPELFEVAVELREVGDSSYSHPQNSFYHLEIVGGNQIRFRMDSVALGTILVGGGSFSPRAIVLTYLTPSGRYTGFESFTVVGHDELVACGSFVADGTIVKTWEVQLERVPDSS